MIFLYFIAIQYNALVNNNMITYKIPDANIVFMHNHQLLQKKNLVHHFLKLFAQNVFILFIEISV